MSYVTRHWSSGPFVITAIVVMIWHEAGLRCLGRRSPPKPPSQRRLRSACFYGGLVTAVLAADSPIDYWAGDYFFVHMIQHLLLMFAAPVLILAGAPWQPLLGAMPARPGRGAAWSLRAGQRLRWLRAAWAVLTRPWAATALFSAVMIAWHIPQLFDLAATNGAVHVWLMLASFFSAGVLFWLQFIPSPPLRPRMPPLSQAVALIATNAVMWVLAMSLSIFTQTSWYHVYAHRPGVRLPAFADQQIGAAILWVCGDFWAIPMLIVVIRRLIMADGGVEAAFDQILGRSATRFGWAGPRACPARGGSAPAGPAREDA